MAEVVYAPLELARDRWWFCADELPDHRIWPVGYCTDKMICPTCRTDGYVDGLLCITCIGEGFVDRIDPCPGHGSPIEATQHWIAYLVDHADYERLGPELRICDAPDCTIETQSFVAVRGHETPLCVTHRTSEVLRALLTADAVVSA